MGLASNKESAEAVSASCALLPYESPAFLGVGRMSKLSSVLSGSRDPARLEPVSLHIETLRAARGNRDACFVCVPSMIYSSKVQVLFEVFDILLD